MRQAINGFTRFMCKLEGKPVVPLKKTTGRWTVSQLVNTDVLDLEYLEDVMVGYPEENLSYSFVWRSTPQGHLYWEVRDNGDVEMSDDDYDFCEALYEVHS